VVAVTEAVFTVNVADVELAGTVTEEGTVAMEMSLLERSTTAPALGAAASSVTVPCDGEPPVTVAGFRVRAPGALALTKALFDRVPPFPSLTVAVIVNTGSEGEAGGKKVAVEPFPAMLPLSAVQEYCNASPFTS